MKSDNKENERKILQAGFVGSSYDTTQKYGSAIKEHIVSLSGIDNENGTILQKSLKSIKKQKLSEEYNYSIRQQKSGWAAEVKDTASTNAENIIAGKNIKKIRHDDLPNTPANHPLFDHVKVDADGHIIAGSGSQMKFIGASKSDPSGIGNAERALKKLQSKGFQKYIDNDVKIEVPKDEYQQMVDKASDEIKSLQKQLQRAEENGRNDTSVKLEKKIDNLKKLKKNLRPSKLTRQQSLEAVDNPELSTFKSITNISHRSGIETAKNTAVIAGSASLIKNVVSLYKGEIEAKEAAMNITKDTVQSATLGYGTGAVGSAIKGAMQNSSSEYTRMLSKTNIAGTIVSIAVSSSKTISKYMNGKIDSTQCMEELGEQGTGMIATSVFSVIGQTVIPIPIVGGLVGGMVGYTLSSATYGVLINTLNEEKLAHEERIVIEKACEEHVSMIRKYRAQLNALINEYLSASTEVFNASFNGIKEALNIGNVDLLIENANNITTSLGGNKPFENMEEFNNKMLLGQTFKI